MRQKNLWQNIVSLEHQIYASQKKSYTTAGCDGWDIEIVWASALTSLDF